MDLDIWIIEAMGFLRFVTSRSMLDRHPWRRADYERKRNHISLTSQAADGCAIHAVFLFEALISGGIK